MFLTIVLGPRIGMPHTSLVMAVPQWWTLSRDWRLLINRDMLAASAFEFWPLLNGIVLAREDRGVSIPSSPVCIGRASYILHKCKMGHITDSSYCGILIEAMESLQSVIEKTNPYSLLWVWSHDSTVEKGHLSQAKAQHRMVTRVVISNTGVNHLVVQAGKLKHRSTSSGIRIFRKCRHNQLQPFGSMSLEIEAQL